MLRLLLDENLPKKLKYRFGDGFDVTTVPERGWNWLKNGELLNATGQAGIEYLITADKNLSYQQNLTDRQIAVVVLGRGRWTLIKPMLANIAAAVSAATPGTFTLVEIPDRQ